MVLAISSSCKTINMFAKCLFTTDRIFEGSAEVFHPPKRRDPSDYGRLNPDFQQPDLDNRYQANLRGEEGRSTFSLFFPRFIPAQ
jgi:hypothetical protein